MFSVFKGHRVLLALSILINAVFAALSVSIAFVLENILNAATRQDRALLQRMVVVSICYVVAVAVLSILDSLCQKKLVVRTLRDMRQGIYNGIMGRDAEHFHEVNTADYISALTNDIKTVEENALLAPLQTLGYVFVFLMSAAALFYYSPLIAGIMCLCLIFMYVLPASLGKPVSTRQGLLSQSLAMFTVRLKDQLSGYDVIRSFQLADRSREDFARQNQDISDKRYSVDKVVAASEGLSQVLGVGTQFLVMLFAAWLVIRGSVTVGVMLGIVQLSASFVQPVAIIMQGIPKIKGAKPVLERIQTLSQKTPSAFTGTKKPRFEESVSFHGVSFGYTPQRDIISGLDLVLEKNRKYALVGASGSGKTTLIRLLGAGFGGYSGQIKMDGVEYRELDAESLLTKMSVIHQNVYMFDESIRDNISLRRAYPREAWDRALSISGVDKFLGQVADGLDTPVGENGVSLSGGQRQRVAVARALIENKPILILDEGTSAVDTPTAWDIETALLGAPDITMLTITHNLNPELLRRYDSVLFMEDGRITQAGSYDTLFAAGGGFAEFANMKYNGEA